MTRLAVLSRSDTFHRQIWNAAKDREGARVELRLRSFQEVGELRDVDVLLVYYQMNDFPPPTDPQWAELTPIVFVGCDVPATDPDGPGNRRSFVAEGTDAVRVLVAAEAAAHGFVVVDPECLPPSKRELERPLGRGRVSVTADDRGGNQALLTDREYEALALLAAGKTNQQIAVELGISSNTVKYHLAGIYGALDVNTRAEAVVAAIRRGLISM